MFTVAKAKVTMSVKNTEALEKRAQYVQQTINSRQGEKVDAVIRELADELFLSERTVWRDYTRKF